LARRLSPLGLAAALLQRNDLGLLGIKRTTRLAHAYSQHRNRHLVDTRLRDAPRHLELIDTELAGTSVPEMHDGWALDTSRSLPHLDRLLEEMNSVIEEFGLTPGETYGKPFLRDILPPGAVDRYPSALDFATSPEVLATVARYAGWLVPLSTATLPPGVRLMESSTKYDPQPDGPWRSSQLWHIDYHATPTIYVIVAIREITDDDGPFYFIGATASKRAADALRYGSEPNAYRLADATLEPLVGKDEIMHFCGPAGSVLFVDSSRCFHYGSRRPANPRYHMQYAYTSPVRNDFREVFARPKRYPVRPDDPRLRRLALDPEAELDESAVGVSRAAV